MWLLLLILCLNVCYFTREKKSSKALDCVLEYIKTKPFGPSNRVALTCNINNPKAIKLYKDKGFAETGVIDDDEIELVFLLK